MEMSGQLHDLAALPLGKGPHYAFGMRLGGPQSWSGLSGEEKKSLLCPCHKLNLGCPAHISVTVLTIQP